MDLRFQLRDDCGVPVQRIPFNWWTFFQAEKEVGEITQFQGHYSPIRTPLLHGLLNVRRGKNLHHILEVWRRVSPMPYLDNRNLTFDLFSKYLLAYTKREFTEDGLYREKSIGQSPEVLLGMCIVEGDPDNPDESGSYSGVDGGNTAEQMIDLVDRCLASNPEVASGITEVVNVGGVGLSDHPVSLNGENLLDVLNDMEAASYHAFSRGFIPQPVSFRLVPNSDSTWRFEVGLFGTDRRVSSTNANPILLSARLGNIRYISSVSDHTKSVSEVRVFDSDGNFEVVEDLERLGYSRFNRRQRHSNGRNVEGGATDELIAVGEADLRELGELDEIEVGLFQQSGARFGFDFFMRDWISTSLDRDDVFDYQVRGVKIAYNNNGVPTLALTLTTLDGRSRGGRSAFEQVVDLLTALDRKIDLP